LLIQPSVWRKVSNLFREVESPNGAKLAKKKSEKGAGKAIIVTAGKLGDHLLDIEEQ
jgi:hypothetical protein